MENIELAPLHILNIEDSSHDSLLLKLELQDSSLDIASFFRVQTEDELSNALVKQHWDVIICDFYLPGFDAFAALKVINSQIEHVPVILYSGQVSSEDAIHTLQEGVDEIVFKNHRQFMDVVIRRVILAYRRSDDLKAAKQRITALENSLNITATGLQVGVWEWQIFQDKLIWNANMYQLYGVDASAFKHTYQAWRDCVHPDDVEDLEKKINHCLSDRSILSAEFRVIFPDKSIHTLSVYAMAEWNEAGAATCLRGINQDVTELSEMQKSLYIATSIFDETEDAILITDKNEKILRCNYKFTLITGYSAEEALGKTPRLFKSGQHDADFYKNMWMVLDKRGEWRGGIWNKRKNGDIYFQLQTINTIKDQHGEVAYYISKSVDSSTMSDEQVQSYCLAHYDLLTGLPNRYLIVDNVRKAFHDMKQSGKHGALILLDLDRFKVLNDSLGHNAGDEVIKIIAERLSYIVRESDIVARTAGDEFIILLTDLDSNVEHATQVIQKMANKIRLQISLPFLIEEVNQYITCSIGCLLFPDGIENADKLFALGDMALHQAKETRDSVRFYNTRMRNAVEAEMLIEHGLRNAIGTSAVKLHYQVQVRNKRAVSAEALCRWNDADRGWISPEEFIPVAENSGLIFMLGEWVIREGCRQIKIWEEQGLFEGDFEAVSINLSALQFKRDDFVDQLLAIVEESGIELKHLSLELTESVLIKGNDGNYHQHLERLKEAGFLLEIDDFGTGYCSFDYLKKLQVDVLKIDQSFVRDIMTDKNDFAIVKAIIAMSDALNIQVIAEGVEDKMQADELISLGCTWHQGYYYSRPIPASEMFEWVQDNQ